MRETKETNTAQTPPLVSVIMPTYNHAKFIGDTIKSVLNQSYRGLELIIIDNYSEDNTEEIVTSFHDKRIKYLKFRNHGIIAASRNFGIKNSQGKYIAFLDSDDLWLPQKLEKQIRIFENLSDIAMVYTRFRILEGNNVSSGIYPKNGKFKSGYVFNLLYLRTFIACSGVMVKKSVLDQVGLFDTNRDLIAIEDIDLWLRIALKHVIKCTDNSPLFLYRIQSQSVSHSYVQKMRRWLIIAKRYKKYAGNYLFWKSVFLLLMFVCKNKLSRSLLNGILHRMLSKLKRLYDPGRNNNGI